MGIVTNSFSPIDSGGYDFEGYYYPISAARIADGTVSEDVYVLYNTANIKAYLSGLDNPTVTVSFDLRTVGSVGIDFTYLQFSGEESGIQLQTDVLSHKHFVNKDINQYQGLENTDGDSVGPVDVTNSTHVSYRVDSEFFTRSSTYFPYYRGFLLSQGEQGQLNLTQVSNFTLTVSGTQSVNILGLFSDARIYDGATLAAFSEVTLTNNSNPSGAGDRIVITIEDNAGDATGTRGTLSLPTPGSAILAPDNSVPGRYTLVANGLGDLQAALRSLIYTPPNASGGELRVNFQLDYQSNSGILGTTTALESILVYDDLGLNARTTFATGTDQSPLAPFAGVDASLPADDINKTVYATITLVRPDLGTLSGPGLVVLAAGVYQLDRDEPVVFSTLADQLQAISFIPFAGRIPPNNAGQFDIQVSVTDGSGTTTKFAQTSVTLLAAQAVTAGLVIDTGPFGANIDGITSADGLTGTGNANATLTFSNGSTVLGSTMVKPDGTWRYFPPPLADGAYTLTVSQTLPNGPDAALQAGAASVTFVLDTTPPVVTVALANDTGFATSDRITSDGTLRGTGDANALVTISEGGAVLGTTMAGSNGAWIFNPKNLSDGDHSLTASETDVAGNPGSSQFFFTLDTTAPVVTATLANDTGVSSIDGITNDSTLRGTADANAIVTISLGSFVIDTVVARSDGAWSFTPQLSDGSYVLTASVTDAAGNVGRSPVAFMLDTRSPTMTAALANDTGPSVTDRITSNGTLRGTGDANALVTISERGLVLGTTTAGSDGSWTFAPTLMDGSHFLTASESDAAGNTSFASVDFMLDTAAPVVTAALASDTGVSFTDGITSKATLTGTGEANALVTVRNSSTVLGTTTAGSDGKWSFAPTLTDGTYTLTASETDAAGNTGSSSVTFTRDTVAPAVSAKLAIDTGTSATDGLTKTGIVSGTGEANALVTIRNGSTVLGATTVRSNGTWSYAPTLADGTYTLTASATDAAGNTGAASSVTFTLDATRPAMTSGLVSDTGRSATDHITKNAMLKGTGEANALITIRDGSAVIGTTTARANGTWTYKPMLTDGNYILTASETDVAGNTGSTSIRFTLDTTRPVLTVGLANDTGRSATDRVTSNAKLTGTGDANALVTISNGETVLGTTRAGSDGTWTYTPRLVDGSYTLTASQTDAAGNTGTKSVLFTLDTKAPVVTARLANDTGRSATDKITSISTLTGTGEANAFVTIRNGETVLGVTKAGADGTWTHTPRLLDGSYALTASQTDAASNVGSSAVRFTLDTKPPAVTAKLANDTGASATDGITSNATLTGTGEANALVTIRNDATTLGTARAGSDGAWTYSPRLADGNYKLTASETDAAGNTGSSTVHFTLDTTPSTSFSNFLSILYDTGGTNGNAMFGDQKMGDAVAGIAAAASVAQRPDFALQA